MDISKLTSNVLRQLLKLSERKEALLTELKKIEANIVAHLKGESITSPSVTHKKNPSIKKQAVQAKRSSNKRAARGMIKEQIFQALAEAGSAGMKIPDIAQKIGAKNANVHVWFSNTGKKLSEIERLGPGHFRLHHKQSAQAPVEQKAEKSSINLKKDPQEDLPL